MLRSLLLKDHLVDRSLKEHGLRPTRMPNSLYGLFGRRWWISRYLSVRQHNADLLQDDNGFTLVEVIVSITIMSFLTLGMYSMIADGAATKDRITESDQGYLQIQMALNRIDLDLLQIYSPLYYSYIERGEEERSRNQTFSSSSSSESFPMETSNGHIVPLLSNRDKGQLMFFTSSNRRKIQDNKESRYTWIHYFLKEDRGQSEDNSPVLVRRSLSANPYHEDILQNTDFIEQKLLKNVTSLQFQYWDVRKEEFVDIENMDPRDYFKTPLRAIKTIIVQTDIDGNEETFEKVSRPLYPYFDVRRDRLNRESIRAKWEKDREEKNNKSMERERPPNRRNNNTNLRD